MKDWEQQGRETPLEIENHTSPEEIATRLAFAGLILPSQRRVHLPAEMRQALEIEMSPNEMGQNFNKLIRANILITDALATLEEKLPQNVGKEIYPIAERYRHS